MKVVAFVLLLICRRGHSFTQSYRNRRSSLNSQPTGISDSFGPFEGDYDTLCQWEDGVQESLVCWAESSGIQFFKHLSVDEDGSFVTNEEGWQGDSLLQVPRSMILRSTFYENTPLKDWVEDLVSKADGALCLLTIRLLEEMSKGDNSDWYPWLKSLPTKYKTAVFWDDVERSHVRQMAPDALQVYTEQWEMCSHVVQLLQYGFFEDEARVFSPDFRPWLQAQDDLEFILKRVFSIVCACSWKSMDGKRLKIVPFAELLGRDHGRGNVRPFIRTNPESPLQVVLTQDVQEGEKLCMPCSMGNNPARPLINCGFVDYSVPQVEAHVVTDSLLEQMVDWPTVDVTKLVVSTRTGEVSGETWKVFLYSVLQQFDPSMVEMIIMAEEDDRSGSSVDSLVEEAMRQWEGMVTNNIRQHFQSVLETRYPSLYFSQEELESHGNLRLIMEFNLYMRTTFMKVLRHIDEVANQDISLRLSYSLQT